MVFCGRVRGSDVVGEVKTLIPKVTEKALEMRWLEYYWSGGEAGAGAGGMSVEDTDSDVLVDVVVRDKDSTGLGVVTRRRRLYGVGDGVRTLMFVGCGSL
ncbi:hypothetical protein J6590_072115 [Homalodisca vitripennis]|nr:hypothetical protein J6590_072115 [Homalodisca vitripennis]